MNNNESLKRSDQIKLLEITKNFTDTGEFEGVFTYPNCGWDLLQMGLVSRDGNVTPAGRAALWLLGKGTDPTISKVCETFTIPKNKITAEE